MSRAEVAGPEEEAEFGPPGGGVEGLGVGVGGELAGGGGDTVTCGEGMLVRLSNLRGGDVSEVVFEGSL